MRKFSGNEVQQKTRSFMNAQSWDYSFQNVPWRRKLTLFYCSCLKSQLNCYSLAVASPKNKIAGDTSLMTYRGHSVLRTLIRCRFSPAFSTGQRYIYSGCAAGKIFSETPIT